MTNFKILKVQTFGNNELIYHYYSNTDLKRKNYELQLDFLVNETVGFPSKGFIEGFNRLGNNCEIIYHDIELLQKTWAQENNIIFEENNWSEIILLKQIQIFKPDVIFFQDIFSLKEKVRKKIKNLIPSIKIVIIQKGYPGETRDLSDADILFVNSPILKRRYHYLKPHLIYHSFDNTILDKLDVNKPKSLELAYFGSLRYPEIRYEFLKKLSNDKNLEIFAKEKKIILTNKNEKKIKGFFKKIILKLTALSFFKLILLNLSKFIYKERIYKILNEQDFSKSNKKNFYIKIQNTDGEIKKNSLNKELYGIEYYKKIQETKICFNINSDFSENTVDNMKMFEITGVNSCLLTEDSENINDIFKPDSEVVTFSSYPDAIEKLNFLQNNPKIVKEISNKGHQRTLKDHTIFKRCEEMNLIIKDRFKKLY